ncbi:MAG: hypothetical protein J0H52_14440 [Comamonadaceae bacterium]|nr:hypothetical protein [Comamonadaceae bacterium]MBN9365467.1 hypothetical protein [Comamonadaceae bacterium]
MHILFVGGLQHGNAMHIEDDVKLLELEDPRLKAGRQVYERFQWQQVDAAHGFDALFINSFVMESEREAKILDALEEARKQA